MIIDCISDLHGHYPKLQGGDLLIIAGDWTRSDTVTELFHFFDWVHEQDYRKKIVIAGNHDNAAQNEDYKGPRGIVSKSFTYLCDSGTEFEGLKIWGSPWTKAFPGMNPKCKAFTLNTDEELHQKWSMIPEDTHILITHYPAHGICDDCIRYGSGESWESAGSLSLRKQVFKIKPKMHVFGHLHEAHGQIEIEGIKFINASYVTEHYQPFNKPIRVILRPDVQPV